jgi:hypothetical protein
MEQFSIYKQIRQVLDEAGWKIFSPGTHVGQVHEPYLVVIHEGEVATDSTEYTYQSIDRVGSYSSAYYEILLYIPGDQYSISEDLELKLKKDMLQCLPEVKPTGQVQAPVWNDQVSGWQISIQYVNYKAVAKHPDPHSIASPAIVIPA